MTPVLVLLLLAQTPQSRPADESTRFAELSAQAAKAREQERWADAERLYREAVRLRPGWKEGWWYLGTMLYDQDRYAEAGAALRRFSALDPKVAPAWAFLGLCEFETKEFPEARGHLGHAVELGLDETSQLNLVTRYHLALLETREGHYETALEILMRLAERGYDRPEFVEAAGLAALRRALLPAELQPGEKELTIEVGRAVIDTGARRASDAQREFRALVESHPRTPEIHYLFGSFLLTSDPDAGLAELRKELEISPRHLPSLLQIAFEYLKRGDGAAALPYAKKAVEAEARSFVAHIALGRALVESGDVAGGIKELEISRDLSPDSPQIRIALASAYAKAGRKADAARERAEFLRLKKPETNKGAQ